MKNVKKIEKIEKQKFFVKKKPYVTKTLRYKKGCFLVKVAKNSVNTTKNISFVNIEKVGYIGC